MRKLMLATVGSILFAFAAPAGESITLRLGYETPRSDSQHLGAQRMAKALEEKTGGRLKLQLFPDAVLGNSQGMITQVRAGTVDMYMGGSAIFTGVEPRLNVLDIPFLFHNPRHVDDALDAEVGEEMLKTLEAVDMKGLAYWENGFRSVTNGRNPVNKPEDVKGLKIRTLANPMHIEAWRLLGTNPVPMPISELYTALETGAVEAQEHPVNVTYSAKLYEVQKYLSMTRHAYSPLIISINLKKFESLDGDLRDALVETAREAGKWQRKYVRDNEKMFVDKMAEEGIEVVWEVDMQPFRDIVEKDVRKLYTDQYGDDWLKKIDAHAK
ncbi:MAG: TRAP transporter substrate-binding protein [Planctomycetota bacterium]|nr:TRAP transporter substrate-binding protein [Planctomycetota bacterium]